MSWGSLHLKTCELVSLSVGLGPLNASDRSSATNWKFIVLEFLLQTPKSEAITSEFRPGLVQTSNAGTPRPVPLALQAQSRPGKVFQEADVRKKEACVKGTEGPV